MIKRKWEFGDLLERLEKEVDEIVGEKTTEELLEELPSEIGYDDVQQAKLVIEKLGSLVWQVSYKVYINPKLRHFEKVSIKAVTEPSLRLALFEMLEEIERNNTK